MLTFFLLTLFQEFEYGNNCCKISPKANQLRLIEAIELLKGVKSITIASDEEISDQFIASQMAASRKSGKDNKDEVMDILSR